MTKPRKQVILGAHFPGVNNTSVWSDPASKSQIEFAKPNTRKAAVDALRPMSSAGRRP